MATKMPTKRNEYRCTIELNQNGKYCVRVRAAFTRNQWVLPVYFLASNFDRTIKKLDQVLQFLQQQEDKLWFWGVDRTDDPNMAGELLAEVGLKRDKRAEFPRKAATLSVAPGAHVPAFMIVPVRKALAESAGSTRKTSLVAAAAASD